MMKAMCSRKVVDRKTIEEQMNILGLKETTNRLATANGVDLKKNKMNQAKWRNGVQAITEGVG